MTVTVPPKPFSSMGGASGEGRSGNSTGSDEMPARCGE
jgi:hypothetical protein